MVQLAGCELALVFMPKWNKGATMSRQMQGIKGARCVINGRCRDYFGSASYLDLHRDARVLAALQEGLAQYGLSGGLNAELPVYQAFWAEAAAFFGRSRVHTFATAYLGNLIMARGLSDRYERVYVDEYAHYSVWDGARISGRPVETFRWRDPESLAETLKRTLRPGERPFVMSDGVFPVTGELAPAADYLTLIEQYDGLICLDDAHATGVIGKKGRGTLEFLGVESERCFATHTLSKGIGVFGGVIAGEDDLIEPLNRRTNFQRGASQIPLPIAAAATRALALARQEPERRQQLWGKVARVKAGVRALGWSTPDTPVPIICLSGRPEINLAQVERALFEQDICVEYGPEGAYSGIPPGGGIRFIITAGHSDAQIDRFIEKVEEVA